MIRAVPGLVGVLAVGFLFILVPTALGGAYSYVIVDQSSWEPKLKVGDLAVVQRRSDYQVGQLVAVDTPEKQYFGQIVGVRDLTYLMWNGDADQPVWVPRGFVVGRLWLNFGNLGFRPGETPLTQFGPGAAFANR